ncbi:MAG: NADH-quinone oxidoreductase subunit N [Firmicutes bacterium]|nr:NADH-quinone oxidoreductase subunit N [Bacillota bacterium]
MSASGFLTWTGAWNGLGPEMVLAGAAFVIMIVEFLTPAGKKAFVPWLSLIAVLGSLAVVLTRFGVSLTAYSLQVNAVDDFGSIIKVVLLIATFLVILLAIGTRKQKQLPYEYSFLVLFATVGAMILSSAMDLILLYVGLELLSIASYVLVALNRRSARSAEGGLKYLIIGSIASACILYGLSFLYGISGSTSIGAIAGTLQTQWDSFSGLVYLSLALVLGGIAVKISAAPFHLWTADVYEGAPTPVTAYLAVVSKAAVLAFFLRVFIEIFGPKMGSWDVLIAWLAVITMIVGNVGALTQRNIKRMLAYSSIGQAGYLLIPLASLGANAATPAVEQMLSSTVFYLFAYAFMTIGAFAVYHIVSTNRSSEDVDAFLGLYRRSPWLAGAMTVFLLSLAGMPVMAGFFGKFMIFLTAFNNGQYWLGVILFATSAIAFYYYFGIIKAMFTREPMGDHDRVPSEGVTNAVIVLCIAGTLFLGVLPNTLMSWLGTLNWFG